MSFRVCRTVALSAMVTLLAAAALPAHAAVTFDDSFEGSFKPAWTVTGEATVTPSLSHGYAYSYVSYPTNTPGNPDIGYIKMPVVPTPTGFASVWYYDDGSTTATTQMFALGAGTGIAFGLGVFTPTVTGTYACRLGSGEVSSGVSRTVGWKEFRIEWSLGINATVYALRIDGKVVCTSSTAMGPSSLQVGDAWSYVLTEGWGYWDDVYVGM
jgi:hypothetical protein